MYQKNPSEEDEEGFTIMANHLCLQDNPTEANLCRDTELLGKCFSVQKRTDSQDQDSDAAENSKVPMLRFPRELGSKITRLEIPKQHVVFDDNKKEALPPTCHAHPPDSSSEDGYETAEESFLPEDDFMVSKLNLFDEEEEEVHEQPIPKEKIIQRIGSHKGRKSYQLAKQLSSRWATGAGPRIGCMRDYPSELQFRVLEQANLSPRSRSVILSPRTSSHLSPKVLTPTSVRRETITLHSSLTPEQAILSKSSAP